MVLLFILESDTETLTEKNGGSRGPKWSRRSSDEKAFEVVSDIIKPVLENTPKGLSDYLTVQVTVDRVS